MSEYVKKEEVIKLIREDKVEITPNLLTIAMLAAPNGYSVEDCYKAINDTCDRHIKEIRNLPAADVVEVVRCKDCIHRPSVIEGTTGGREWRRLEFPDFWCPMQCEDSWYDTMPSDDFFCKYGERKEKSNS